MRISDWSSDVCSSDLFCCNGLGQHLLSDPFDVRETQACKAQRLHGVGVARSAGELSQHHEARKCFTIILIALAAVEVPDLRHHAYCRLGGQSRYQFLPRNAGCADTVTLGADLCDVVLERRQDRKSTSLTSSHKCAQRMSSSA